VTPVEQMTCEEMEFHIEYCLRLHLPSAGEDRAVEIFNELKSSRLAAGAG